MRSFRSGLGNPVERSGDRLGRLNVPTGLAVSAFTGLTTAKTSEWTAPAAGLIDIFAQAAGGAAGGGVYVSGGASGSRGAKLLVPVELGQKITIVNGFPGLVAASATLSTDLRVILPDGTVLTLGAGDNGTASGSGPLSGGYPRPSSGWDILIPGAMGGNVSSAGIPSSGIDGAYFGVEALGGGAGGLALRANSVTGFAGGGGAPGGLLGLPSGKGGSGSSSGGAGAIAGNYGAGGGAKESPSNTQYSQGGLSLCILAFRPL